MSDEPRCQEPTCPSFGDPDFGEATCPFDHAVPRKLSSYDMLVAALREAFPDAGIEALWIRLRDLRFERGSISTLVRAINEARPGPETLGYTP